MKDRCFLFTNSQGVKLLSRLRLNINHLSKHKGVIPMCGCGLEIKSTQHFFLLCHFYHVKISELLYDIDLATNELN